MSPERAHLSIGEVLSLLQSEFPDVTISKIRFLESQGLLVPERTPSGYRKFHDEDIERLRWILTQQRDHFLPLKVIKERIEAGDLGSGPPEGVLPFTREGAASADPVRDDGPVPGRTGDPRGRAEVVASLVEGPATEEPVRASRRHPTGHVRGEAVPTAPAATRRRGRREETALTRSELAELSGLEAASIDELERFGLITATPLGDAAYFDEDSLVVTRLAAGFARYGIEPRHLRMYKVSAEREAGLFEQLIMPLLKQRRAAARDEAVEMLEDLAELADDLRAVMVRNALRGYLGGS